MSGNGENVLSIKNLSTWFLTADGVVKAVNDVSLDIASGRTLGLVGESGCGKSVTALSVLRLIPNPPGRIVEGEILYKGRDLLKCSGRKIRAIRGNEIAMIFQEPMTSLNPVYTIGNQITEAVRLHKRTGLAEIHEHALKMLEQVGIADPNQRLVEYPHQLSGGMRQRVMIAMALSCSPSLLIADEPTTALDVTIQAQILELLRRLQKETGMAILLITHDLGVVAENADDVAVAYASKIVEKGPVEAIFNHPLHPYTQGLLRSLPRMGAKKDRLDIIGGSVPDPLNFPTGCKFHPRCPIGRDKEKCHKYEPPLKQVRGDVSVACWYAKGYDGEPELVD
jgi:oligopeptide/dipeptide ABC transporter ATP-binding protein